MTADAKLRTVRNVLQGLAHAHSRRIAHREVNPSNDSDRAGRPGVLTGFEYAKTAQRRGHTV